MTRCVCDRTVFFHSLPRILLLFVFLFLNLFILVTATTNKNTSTSIQASAYLSLKEYTLFIHESPFEIHGITYQASALGAASNLLAFDKQKQIWHRDLPLIRKLGANTIRTYWQWDSNANEAMLDACAEQNLRVIAIYTPDMASSPEQNVANFAAVVERYKTHKTLLGWMIHDAWNTQKIQAIGKASGCLQNDDKCSYEALFAWLNKAASAAKNGMDDEHRQIIVASFSTNEDGGSNEDKQQQMHWLDFEMIAPNVDAWGVQAFPGKNWGSMLEYYASRSQKPLIITEYGVDAYYDSCGMQPKGSGPCYESGHEDEVAQADWLESLTIELIAHSSARLHGSVVGGFVFNWVDEYWRNGDQSVVRGCFGPIPYGKPGFDESLCDDMAHPTCPERDPWYHGVCGYPSSNATFDGYTNVAWFGIMRSEPMSEGQPDRLTPRLAYRRLQDIWTDTEHHLSWLWLALATLIAAASALLFTYRRYKQRALELGVLQRQYNAVGADQVGYHQDMHTSATMPSDIRHRQNIASDRTSLLAHTS